MLTHAERLAAARSTIDYITGRSAHEQKQPVPNCPGWTVYNAAVHIGRVSIAWESMIRATPDDPDSRTRGYARSEETPAASPMSDLAAWAHAAIDQLDGDAELNRPCYFSMTGGEGTVALWGWHVASELGVHRLDIEAALGHEHSLTPEQAIDAAVYACTFFLPAMRRVGDDDPGGLTVRLRSGAAVETVAIESPAPQNVTIEGEPTQVLLALWGRPHGGVSIIDGDPEVLAGWQAMPGKAFQFGTWD